MRIIRPASADPRRSTGTAVLVLSLPDEPRRIPSDYRELLDVVGDNASCAHHTAASNGHTWKDNRMTANPREFADGNAFEPIPFIERERFEIGRIEIVIGSHDRDVRSEDYPPADAERASSVEHTALIDEYFVAYDDPLRTEYGATGAYDHALSTRLEVLPTINQRPFPEPVQHAAYGCSHSHTSSPTRAHFHDRDALLGTIPHIQ